MLPVKSNLLPTVSKFFEDDWNNLFDWTNRNFSQIKSTLPSVNIEDDQDHILIKLAVPGMKKTDFKVELNNDILSIKGESETKRVENEGKRFSIKEFDYSSFHRTFNLNNAFIDNQKIEAQYKDGVLMIRLAKKEEAKEKPARQITIK